MEQKKTLWIALSSGIFLLVVLGAALVIYAPGSKTNSNAFALRESGQVWTASLPPSQNASQGGLIASEPGTLSGTFTPSAASKANFDSPVQDGVVKTDSMTVYSEQTTFYTTGDVNSDHSSKMELSSNAGTVSSSSRGSNVSATNSKVSGFCKILEIKRKLRRESSLRFPRLLLPVMILQAVLQKRLLQQKVLQLRQLLLLR